MSCNYAWFLYLIGPLTTSQLPSAFPILVGYDFELSFLVEESAHSESPFSMSRSDTSLTWLLYLDIGILIFMTNFVIKNEWLVSKIVNKLDHAGCLGKINLEASTRTHRICKNLNL